MFIGRLVQDGPNKENILTFSKIELPTPISDRVFLHNLSDRPAVAKVNFGGEIREITAYRAPNGGGLWAEYPMENLFNGPSKYSGAQSVNLESNVNFQPGQIIKTGPTLPERIFKRLFR